MPPVAQPKSKYESVAAAINEYSKTGIFTPFDLKRLRKEAIQIKENVDLVLGFELLGMIARFETDIDEVHRCHKIAIEQSGQDPIRISNYIRSLISFNLFDEAYNLAFESYGKDPLHIHNIDMVLAVTGIFNEKEKFSAYLKDWEKITGKAHYLTHQPIRLLKDSKAFFQFLREHPDVKDIYTLFEPGIIEYFGPPLTVIMEIMPEPGHDDELVAWIQWHGDMEDGMKRYDAFEDWFIDNDYDLKSDVLHFNIEIVGE